MKSGNFIKVRFLLSPLTDGKYLFQVLYTHPSFVNPVYGYETKSFFASNKIYVCSDDITGLTSERGKSVYLWGCDTEYRLETQEKYLSESRANEIIFAIKEWANKWDGFNDSDIHEPPNPLSREEKENPYIYEF